MFACQTCGKSFSPARPRWRCDCGGMLDWTSETKLHPEVWAGQYPDMWRYQESLPVIHSAHIVSLGEGFTPLTEMTLDSSQITIKQDYLFPTGSFKDRGASVLVSKMKEWGITHCVEDSSGNAGSAIAAYCARAGIRCDIYVPASASPAKLEQIKAYGAQLVAVNGSREDTACAAFKAAESSFYASHVWHPLFMQGTKTAAFECWEQLDGTAPDIVILPVGNGSLLLGVALGFRELKKTGAINRLPRLIAVQAEQVSPVFAAFHQTGGQICNRTCASGIAVAHPRRLQQIVRELRECSGMVIKVDENAILDAKHFAARQGIYVELSAAAALAGARQVEHMLSADETAILFLTGHGLK
ncbi:MAG: threonine synthase [candidate division KSB1 bacterium]|nr:threonine synthase [candidate division KSB1 bacterium]